MKNALSSLMLSVVLLSPALGQDAKGGSIRGLDDERFIRGLRERGMTDLIEAFLKDYKTDDPLVNLSILAETYKGKAQDPEVAEAEKKQAFLDALATYKELVKKAPPREYKTPLWATDYVEYVLTAVLPERYTFADAFVEFGVPTIEQEKEFGAIVPDLHLAMDQAYEDTFYLVGELPRQKNFNQAYVNNGRWKVLTEEYNELKIPFYRAMAHYYASLLPKPPATVNLSDADAGLIAVIDSGKLPPVALAKAISLRGRIALKQGKPDEAIKHLQAAMNTSGAGAMDVFLAQLAIAQAMVLQKKNDLAMAQITEASNRQVATENPYLLILAFDSLYRVTKDTKDYEKLFAHPAAKDKRASFEAYVSKRIVERNAGATAGSPLPSIEGKSELEVIALADARIAAAASIQDAAEKSKVILEGESLLKALLERPNLDKSLESKVRWKIGTADFQRKDNLVAATAWLELAEKLPDQAEAPGAAVNAFKLANALYKQNKDKKTVVDFFERAAKAMLEKFPEANFGRGELAKLHWYTFAAFYLEQKRYPEAVATYAKVTADHPLYLNALYESLVAQFNLWLETEPDAKKKSAEKVVVASDTLTAALEKAKPANDEQKDEFLHWQGDALLMKAQAWTESLNETGKAKASLDGYDAKYGKFPDLLNQKRQLVIGLSMQLGRVQEARDEVQKFIALNPGKGGPLIKAVLDMIDRLIDEQIKVDPKHEKIGQYRQAGVDLSKNLMDWAEQQEDLKKDPKQLLYFQMLYGQALLASAKWDEAVKQYERLSAIELGKKADGTTETGGDQAFVVYGLARAYQGAGQGDKAMPLYNKIINLLPDPKSEYFWGAWAGRMQLLDAEYDKEQNQDAARKNRERNIFLAIRKLEDQTDRNLGGGKHKAELTRLKVKNQPK